ncbi:MAG: hypothetical protein JWL77_6429 [Chthonomonadaceae bacterium]|nr:hypothetical protein [Chthonomonadaceae bacterium]
MMILVPKDYCVVQEGVFHECVALVFEKLSL